MPAELDSESQTLTLHFTESDEAIAYLAEVRSAGGLLVPLDTKLTQYDVVDVDIDLAGSKHKAFRAYAARITNDDSGSFSTAFVLQDWDDAR